MPVLSAHCFANHKGGVGKTTLCYQISAQYAVAHPDTKVLVADFTAAGDVSELLLGGVHEDRGRKALNTLVALSNTTNFCLKALSAAAVHLDGLAEGRFSRQEPEGSARAAPETSLFETVLEHMPRRKRANLTAESRVQEVEFRGEGAIDLSEFALPVYQVNARVPSNLYLCPSGAEFEPPIRFSQSQQRRIISILRNCFKFADGDWKVFIDTDAANDGGSEVYTEIALCISNFCLLPLHADISEWIRAQTTFGVLRHLREQGISECKVQMVLWNKLSVRNSREGFFCDTQTCSFTPTKAEQDTVRTLYNLLYQVAAQYPADFFNFSVENPRAGTFKPAVCMRHLTVVGLASKDVGVPVATIHAGIFHGVHMTYNLSQYSVDRCRYNLKLVVEAIDEGDELLESRRGPLNEAVNFRKGEEPGVEARDQQPSRVQEHEVFEIQEEAPSGVQEEATDIEQVSEKGRESAGSETPSPDESSTSEGILSETDSGYLEDGQRDEEMVDVGIEEQQKSEQSRVKRRGRSYKVLKTYDLRNHYSLRSRSCAARFSLHADGRPWLRS